MRGEYNYRYDTHTKLKKRNRGTERELEIKWDVEWQI